MIPTLNDIVAVCCAGWGAWAFACGRDREAAVLFAFAVLNLTVALLAVTGGAA